MRLFLAILLACLGIGTAQAEPFLYRVEGVFTVDSFLTPGLVGDSYVLTVEIDSATVGFEVEAGVHYEFFGGLANLTVAGIPVFVNVDGAIGQGCCGASALQVAAVLPGNEFFIGYFEGMPFPDPSVLTDPTLLAGRGSPRFAYENTLQTGSVIVGTADLVSTPEPAILAIFGLGLAGLGLARRRRAA